MASTQKRKGREYKEESRLAGEGKKKKSIPTERREGDSCVRQPVSGSSPMASIVGEKIPPLSAPTSAWLQDEGGKERNAALLGRSVGGIRVNAARAFCGGSH